VTGPQARRRLAEALGARSAPLDAATLTALGAALAPALAASSRHGEAAMAQLRSER
jgi:hypothetical protein